MNALEMTQEQLDTSKLNHKYDGPGLLFIRDLANGPEDSEFEMCQCGYYDVVTSGIARVFVVRKELLTESMIPVRKPSLDDPNPPMVVSLNTENEIEAVALLRKRLASGEAVIDRQRVVSVKAA